MIFCENIFNHIKHYEQNTFHCRCLIDISAKRKQVDGTILLYIHDSIRAHSNIHIICTVTGNCNLFYSFPVIHLAWSITAMFETKIFNQILTLKFFSLMNNLYWNLRQNIGSLQKKWTNAKNHINSAKKIFNEHQALPPNKFIQFISFHLICFMCMWVKEVHARDFLAI